MDRRTFFESISKNPSIFKKASLSCRWKKSSSIAANFTSIHISWPELSIIVFLEMSIAHCITNFQRALIKSVFVVAKKIASSESLKPIADDR